MKILNISSKTPYPLIIGYGVFKNNKVVIIIISIISKREIRDVLMDGMYKKEFYFYGTESEISFLERIVDLNNLPSYDSRFDNMIGDIWQHTENNDDWDLDWVFTDDRLNLKHNNQLFKEFLEQVFHPMVRDSNSDWRSYLDKINTILMHDNLQLIATQLNSGRPQYTLMEVKNSQLIANYSEVIKEKFNSDYIDSQVSLMLENIDANPNIAIGQAKELLESCAKTILEELEVEYDDKLEFIPLLKKVFGELGLSAKNQNKDTQAGEIASKLLGNLGAVPQRMAELRNAYGSGHGKSKRFVELPPRYARLAVGTSVTMVNFLWETYEDRKTNF